MDPIHVQLCPDGDNVHSSIYAVKYGIEDDTVIGKAVIQR